MGRQGLQLYLSVYLSIKPGLLMGNDVAAGGDAEAEEEDDE